MKYNSKNILHVVNIYFVLPYFIGGQFKYFKDKGYNMHVICSESKYLPQYAKEQGFDYKIVPILRAINLLQDFKSILKICQYIKEKQIDIIVGHTPKGGLLSMIAGWIMRVPNRIYFRHGLVYQTSKGLKRFLLKSIDKLTSLLATKIVCVSPSVLETSIKDKLAPEKKQIILHKGTCCGIDTEGIFNTDCIDKEKLLLLKSKWAIKESDWVIGYSGRLVRDKGIIELIRAFRIVKAENPNYKLLLVGMFEVRDALPEDVQQDIKNDSQIVWTDFQNSDMEYFYSMMNVYVLASYREGFPTGVLEAQSMKVPVITTRATGCCDSIIENETGLFIHHNAEELAAAIQRIHNHETQLSGEKARQWVRNNFENHIVWKEIEKLY